MVFFLNVHRDGKVRYNIFQKRELKTEITQITMQLLSSHNYKKYIPKQLQDFLKVG